MLMSADSCIMQGHGQEVQVAWPTESVHAVFTMLEDYSSGIRHGEGLLRN